MGRNASTTVHWIAKAAFCAAALFTTACALSRSGPSLPARAMVDGRAESLFAAEGARGAFVLLHAPTRRLWVVNPERATRRHTPASTFKIPNTLLGLSTGVVPGREFRLRWDGHKRFISSWNRDHDLASAMRHSVVWFYQEIARRIGIERMRDGVWRLEYGNRDIAGGVDRFWLDGALRISAYEQVRFLDRLWKGALPFDARQQALVRSLLVEHERVGERVWRGKTGTAIRRGGQRITGWLVGAVDSPDGPWLYALVVRAPRMPFSQLIPLRHRLTRALLVRFGALPALHRGSDATKSAPGFDPGHGVGSAYPPRGLGGRASAGRLLLERRVGRKVAVTIDDLPIASFEQHAGDAERRACVHDFARLIQARRIPAAGFVNMSRHARDPTLLSALARRRGDARQPLLVSPSPAPRWARRVPRRRRERTCCARRVLAGRLRDPISISISRGGIDARRT